MLYAGVDIGTSGCKAIVYDLDGNVHYKASRTYREEGGDGFRELDPGKVKAAFLDLIKEIGQAEGKNIQALAIASLGESIVCIDEDDRELSNSMITGDSRGKEEVQELIERFGAEEIFRITGLPPCELYGLPKYMWLNRNTDAIRKAQSIFFYEDYIGYLLTGNRAVSYTSAARSMAFNIQEKKWCGRLLEAAGIRMDQMSVPVPPFTVIGKVLPEVAQQTGLSQDTKVVVGGHDQSCAALGSGLMEGKTGECGLGTCGYLFIMMDHIETSEFMQQNDLTCSPYFIPGSYSTGIEVTTCGALRNWARENLFADADRHCRDTGGNYYEYMDSRAAEVDTKVMVLPEFGSSGTPDMDMDAVGTITGLTVHTSPEEIYKAILEGLSFQMRYAYERLTETGTKIERIVATGGGARSDLNLQIMADIMKMDVLTLETEESGTLGCAVMAILGDREDLSLSEVLQKMVRNVKTFCPRSDQAGLYDRKYLKYEQLYRKMHHFE